MLDFGAVAVRTSNFLLVSPRESQGHRKLLMAIEALIFVRGHIALPKKTLEVFYCAPDTCKTHGRTWGGGTFLNKFFQNPCKFVTGARS